MNVPRTIHELVTACRGESAEQVRIIVDMATADACPNMGTSEWHLYNAIFDEGQRLDPEFLECNPEPFRASMIAMGEHYDIQGMREW
jgi:hypothetical protein